MSYIIFSIAFIFLVWFYVIYSSLIRKKNKALEALSGIDVQLKKRHDLISNLVEVTKGFMRHEKNIFENVTKLRTMAQGDVTKIRDAKDQAERFGVENALDGQVKQLLIAVENYPELKSNQTVLQLQKSYSDVEEHIAASRRFYNSTVNDINNKVEIFPGSLVASLVGIRKKAFFKAEDADKDLVNV